MFKISQKCNKNLQILHQCIFQLIILSFFRTSTWRQMNLYTLTLSELSNHGDNKERTKWSIFYIFISTNSNYLPTTTSTMSKLTVSFTGSEHSTIVILKGDILVFFKEPCFNYWALLSLQFFLPVLSPANDFSCDFDILENSDIHTKLF